MTRLPFFGRIVTAALAVSCVGCQTRAQPGDVDTPAPSYGAPSLAGHDTVRLAQLRGSLVLLNVWATWCIPCRQEIPELQALHQRYSASGLKIIGVSIDDAGTDADVADFVKEFSMTYIVLRDPQDYVSDLFRTRGVPSSFLIDRTGVVRWRHLGPFTAKDEEFERTLKKYL